MAKEEREQRIKLWEVGKGIKNGQENRNCIFILAFAELFVALFSSKEKNQSFKENDI